MPGTALAGAYETLMRFRAAIPIDWRPVIIGVVVAGISGVLCIHFLLRFIQRIGMLPFTIYRLLLAAVIVYVFA